MRIKVNKFFDFFFEIVKRYKLYIKLFIKTFDIVLNL